MGRVNQRGDEIKRLTRTFDLRSSFQLRRDINYALFPSVLAADVALVKKKKKSCIDFYCTYESVCVCVLGLDDG